MMMTTVGSSHLKPQLDLKEASMALRHLAGSLQAEVAQSMVTTEPSLFMQSVVRALHASAEPEPEPEPEPSVVAVPVLSQESPILLKSRSWLAFSILGRATDLAETAATPM